MHGMAYVRFYQGLTLERRALHSAVAIRLIRAQSVSRRLRMVMVVVGAGEGVEGFYLFESLISLIER